MIFKRDFNDLTDDEIKLLYKYFNAYDYQSSGHTLIANYIWRNTHKLSWQVIGDYLCIAGLGTLETEEEEYFMSFPLTLDGTYNSDSLRQTIDTAREIFREKGHGFEISLIPGKMVPILEEAYGDEMIFTHDRDDDDYVYSRESLATLSGRKLHNKKNHLNYFKKTYKYTYEEMTEDTVSEVMDFVKAVNGRKLESTPDEWKEILKLETYAVGELLQLLSTGQLLTGVIRIDGKIEAVTIGEFSRANHHEMVLVHVEKANDDIRGLYQAINNEFVLRLPEDTIYVNREEDMGMDNLRQTKLSYRPVMMAEKYSAVFR